LGGVGGEGGGLAFQVGGAGRSHGHDLGLGQGWQEDGDQDGDDRHDDEKFDECECALDHTSLPKS
jgi:hypothetical protein